MQRRAVVAGALLWPLWARRARAAAAFDHSHAAWRALLERHVVMAEHGFASALHYAGMQAERAQLGAYLARLSAVTPEEYAGWSRAQRLAFLINAYNAFTVELVLSRYPGLESIKDLGTPLRSPWKKKFFRLLGKARHLDALEHGLIRVPGVFDDARIHTALVCASVGCPMLRNEPYVAERLDAQLDDALRRFLSDRSRNRFDEGSGRLAVSRVFDWYRKDFEPGPTGTGSLAAVFARHAEQLADGQAARSSIRDGRYRLEFLPYDWALNDAR